MASSEGGNKWLNLLYSWELSEVLCVIKTTENMIGTNYKVNKLLLKNMDKHGIVT